MLQVNRVYIAKDGTRFYVHAKKQRPSSNGHDYIAENLRSGLITFFNYKGEHPVKREEWKLTVDEFKWCGVFPDGTMSDKGFVIREELETMFEGYLRMQNDNPATITYVTRAGLEKTYA